MNIQGQKIEQTISTDKLINIELRRIISRYSDTLADRAEQLLNKLPYKANDPKLTDTQINGLFSVVNTYLSVASITRFIERQAVRPGNVGEAWNQYDLAAQLLSKVKDLLTDATNLAGQIQQQIKVSYRRVGPDVDALTVRHGSLPEVHYLMVREFIQSFAIGYLYRLKTSWKDKREEER